MSLNLLRLITIVFTAVTLIVIGDTAGKLLGQAGVEPFVVAWSRFAIGVLLVLPFCGLTRADLPSFKDWRVVFRGALITAAICCILTALTTEPIANVFGAFFIGPVISYILAILFLGERPSGRRSVMLAVGFLGVMLVVKPGFGASIGMVFALAAGCLHGTYLVMTRVTATSIRPRFLLFSQLAIGAVVLTPIGVSLPMPFPVLEPDWYLAWLIVLSALGSALGNYMLVIANKQAEASLIAPLIYTKLISATVLGIIVFGDWPDLIALAGLILILTSGIGSLFFSQTKPAAAQAGGAATGR
ncbi:MAG: DMT family transporter [Alphaproteobacteria bacterium]|nr:DMT family transporter [Alphaproteobacteria bacterium SS10]